MRLLHRKVGLALGGGSAKGYAHIGVLEVLEELGVRPDVVAGTSIGAIIGALWVSGRRACELEEIATSLDMRTLMRISAPGLLHGALVGTERLEERLRGVLPERIEDLGMPFACVATDLRTGDRVSISSGDLVAAILASIALPVVFPTVDVGEAVLSDGGIVEPVPVFAARELGAGRIIAVTLCGLVPRGDLRPAAEHAAPSGRAARPADPLHVLLASYDVMQREVSLPALAQADVVIEPDLSGYSQLSWLDATPMIERGRLAARAHASELARFGWI